MPNLTTLMHRIRRLAQPPPADSDADLLGRFARSSDESAFAALVARHGPMVFGVCRRILRDAHAAEDAAQATFLILARRASSVGQPDYLAGWLHGVAYRVASKVRSRSLRRNRYETAVASDRIDEHPDPLAEVSARELLEVLETEIRGLPEAVRLPLVLCCLEGLSQEEAAAKLGCSPGAVRGRLERGRKRLQDRLVRRGLTLPAALAAVLASRSEVSAALVRVTVRGAVEFARDGGKGIVSQQVIALANGGLKAMFWTKMKVMLVVLALSGLVGSGAGWVMTGGSEPANGVLSSPVAAAGEPEQKTKPTGSPGSDKGAAAEKTDKAKREREQRLEEARRELVVFMAVAERNDRLLGQDLVKERQSLAELEERLREEENDSKEAQMPSEVELGVARDVVRLKGETLRIESMKENNLVIGKLLKQTKDAEDQLKSLKEKRRVERKKGAERLIEIRRAMIAKEEEIRQLERKRDVLRQETDRKREAAFDRIQQLEGGIGTDAPDRVQKTMERRLEAIQRELIELRRDLHRQKSSTKQ